jgi:hypothetical protein
MRWRQRVADSALGVALPLTAVWMIFGPGRPLTLVSFIPLILWFGFCVGFACGAHDELRHHRERRRQARLWIEASTPRSRRAMARWN